MYLITRLPKMRRWAISTPEYRLAASVPNYVNIKSTEDTLDIPIEGNEDTFNMFVIQSGTEEQVKNYTKSLAEKNPGVTYYVSKIESGFVCPAAPATEMKFNEKGIIPA